MDVIDFKRTVDFIIDIVVELDKTEAKEANMPSGNRNRESTRQSLKVVTDSPLTIETIVSTLVLPQITKVL